MANPTRTKQQPAGGAKSHFEEVSNGIADISAVAIEQFAYANALFTAIQKLADSPAQTVVDLANLGRWLSESALSNVEAEADRVHAVLVVAEATRG
ncbi:hypothetical protein [Paraburkholderia sp. MM5384-R2]|uniref:hypothetical protein n=1 Tax=Paraburkholderia sp. MM5384-R2 TaxID=2723097 RepID=UPI00160CBB8F|nr:hypothetical protein [Paraburkholderia sp. MM5384-R2]MBB5501551.1 hypothetical protein [Paraburkholderia sp. MM5384-R2]